MINTENDSILKVSNVSFKYETDEYILKDINFEVKESEILGVLGPNGGGKSTLMKIIAGLQTPTKGELIYFGKNLNQYSKFPYDKISYVAQSSTLNSVLPVRVFEYIDFTASLLKISDLKFIDSVLDLVGISHKKNSLISELSGGEKQRVLLARALLSKPRLLLLDEPTKGLDSNGQDQLLHLIETIRNNDKTAVVIVDHNINQIIKSCQKILCLNRHFHWHDRRDFLTKNVLEDIYHCEFEHLLIHEKDLETNKSHDHKYCNHDHGPNNSGAHNLIRRKL